MNSPDAPSMSISIISSFVFSMVPSIALIFNQRMLNCALFNTLSIHKNRNIDGIGSSAQFVFLKHFCGMNYSCIQSYRMLLIYFDTKCLTMLFSFDGKMKVIHFYLVENFARNNPNHKLKFYFWKKKSKNF